MADHSKRREAESEAAVHSQSDDEALPAYTDSTDHQTPAENIKGQELEESTPRLNLLTTNLTSIPTVDSCLAHLRLLRAFEVLKRKTGYTDGLWDIWDSRAQNKLDILSKLREKRWAIFVARAVDRYEAWWKSFVPDMLKEKDMLRGDSEARSSSFECFTSVHNLMKWTLASLPPPDILLVWHTHMLNPRVYLEDCIRSGYGSLWSSGLPWDIVDQSINSISEFSATQEGRINWSERTGHEWANEQDSMHKDMKCPTCSELKSIPWTTCGQDQGSKEKPGLVGSGYGDGNLSTTCKKCGTIINEELLRAAKFRADLRNLITKDWPMPGTIIDVQDGLVKLQEANSDQLFPNRLARFGLLVEITQAFEPGSSTRPSMEYIRGKIEDITLQTKYRHSSDQLKKIDKGITGASTAAHHVLSQPARMQTRCMMSRYWTNTSVFGLDLKGAVMRQGVFCEKMFKINWLQSPTAEFTMEKLLKKYERFFEIQVANPGQIVTPTLDVDLGWHTHQLSPRHYLEYATKETGAFTDHNDKVDEDKLAVSFEWMANAYQEKYGEAYSECNCWFCESLRFQHASSLTQRMTKQKAPQVREPWRNTNQSATEPPHISSHPSVTPLSERNSSRRTERLLFKNDLDATYTKLLKQTNQSGQGKEQKKSFSSIFKSSSSRNTANDASKLIVGPRGEDKAAHWGKSVPLLGPWSSTTFAALTEEMYTAPPGAIHESKGRPGVCAAGTCGGKTGCGNGAIAMCGAGCTGLDKNPFGPGCVG
ncbi:hypothetical protein BKA67DRAFT_660806 [Truncatella angustata]|uniref:Alpha-ketoglutarate-dependent sulfonate dioxygenase n=1 Tax=Truncatella angustata TaxID=152316 RepID=A0A9P8ZWE9_9PEZI|nr:uncharacterized protein BKA67DRAFT_660806 [Truncatella angustata]KAH6652037.1 hypothetical protein BKA67DRAFT_660806 [Truncatella angustata]